MNGATEATLADLLATASAMNVNLIKLQNLIGKMGAPSSGGVAGSAATIAGFAASLTPAGAALGVLKGAAGAVGSVLGVLGGILGKVVSGFVNTGKNLFEFAKAAANGTAKLSDFYAAFKDLPFFVGDVANIFSSIVRYSEGLLTTYRELTKSGASFSGDLFAMAQMATRGFMSLQEFSKIVRANSEIFSTMGGNVESGMTKFVDVQTKLMGPGSKYSKGLLGLGYTAEDTANLLANIMNSQGNMNKKSLANNDMLAASVNNIAREMDLYTKVTGKSREEQEAALKKASFDAAWKTFTQGMTADQQASAALAVDRAFTTGGQGAADALKQLFMTGGKVASYITDAAKQFYVQTEGAAENYLKVMYDSAMNMKTGSTDQLQTQIKAARDLGLSYEEFIGKFGDTGGLLSSMGNNFVNNANLMTTAMKFSRLTNAEISKMTIEAAKKESAQAAGTAAALATAELNIKNFGTMIMNLFNTLVGPIAGKLITFGESITNSLLPVMKDVTNWFSTAFTELSTAYENGGFTGLLKKFGEKLTQGATNIWTFIKPIWLEHIQPALTNAFTGIMDFLKPYFKQAMDEIGDQLNAWVYSLPGGKYIADDPTKRSQKRLEQQVQTENDSKINSLTALIAANQSAQAASQDTSTKNRYGDKIAELREKLELAEYAKRAANSGATAPVKPGDNRHSGTLGMTGSWWEKKDATLNVQAGESVVTPSQMAQLTSQNGVAEGIQQLNSLTAQLLAVMKQNTDYTQRTYVATKDLNGNLFATI